MTMMIKRPEDHSIKFEEPCKRDNMTNKLNLDGYKMTSTFYNEGLARYNEGLARYNEGLARYNEGLARYKEELDRYNADLPLYNGDPE